MTTTHKAQVYRLDDGVLINEDGAVVLGGQPCQHHAGGYAPLVASDEMLQRVAAVDVLIEALQTIAEHGALAKVLVGKTPREIALAALRQAGAE